MKNPFKHDSTSLNSTPSYNMSYTPPDESLGFQAYVDKMLYGGILGSMNSSISTPHVSCGEENPVSLEVKDVINILKSLTDLEESIKGLKNFNTKVLEDRGWYNYYRVLHMSPEELAHFIVVDCRSIVAGADDAEECLAQYLKSEN